MQPPHRRDQERRVKVDAADRRQRKTDNISDNSAANGQTSRLDANTKSSSNLQSPSLILSGCESERFVASGPPFVIRPSSSSFKREVERGERERERESIFGSSLAIRQTGPPLHSTPAAVRRGRFVSTSQGLKKSQLGHGGRRDGEGEVRDGPCNCRIRSGKVLPMQKEQMTPGGPASVLPRPSREKMMAMGPLSSPLLSLSFHNS